MNKPGLLSVALGACAAGALLAALMLVVVPPAQSGDSMHSAHGQTHAIPFRGASGSSAPDFYAEIAKVNARMHEGMAVAPSGDVDQDFIRMMVPHHQGAIDMALVLLKYGHDERLRRLAQSIIVEQGQEIAYMRTLASAPPAEPASRPVRTCP